MLKDYDLKQLVSPLLQWFLNHARVLPWREEPTPYRVWVSEIMLQQTRVEAVKPYFERFTTALPDAKALAVCPEDELLKLWEGLGYYNRVRNMQKAAVEVVEYYGGQLPADYEKLLKLKGIGHYTAGAVASIAYGIPVPAVDGNVLRVLTRVSADDTDIMKQSFRNEMEKLLEKLMHGADGRNEKNVFPWMEDADDLRAKVYHQNLAGAFNQALMELGATICVPNGAPLCTECPWKDFCEAKKQELIGQIPVKSKAKPRKIEKKTVLILRDDEKVAIRKRPAKGLLAGLYELPNVEGNMGQEEVLSMVKEMGYAPIRIQPLGEAKHIFSHIEWHMTGYAVRVEEPEMHPQVQCEKNRADGLLFVEAEDAKEKYAIPSAFAAYAKYMNILLGNEKKFTRFGIVNKKAMNAEAKKALDAIGFEGVDPSTPIDSLNMQDRKLVEIAKTVYQQPEMLVVDETTTALSQKGRDIIYGIMKKMKEENKAVVFISHDLEELMVTCDTLTVLRDGELITTLSKKEMNEDDIKKYMVGREMQGDYYRSDYGTPVSDEVVLKMEDVYRYRNADEFLHGVT